MSYGKARKKDVTAISNKEIRRKVYKYAYFEQDLDFIVKQYKLRT